MSQATKTNLDISYLITNLNKGHTSLLPLLVRYSEASNDPQEVEAINCDNSGITLLFLDEGQTQEKVEVVNKGNRPSKNEKIVVEKSGKQELFIPFEHKATSMSTFYSELATLKKKAYIKLQLETPIDNKEIDDFHLPAVYLMLIVTCGMGFLFCMAYRLGLTPMLSEMRDNIGDEFIFRTIKYIYAANTLTAALAWIVCYLRGNYSVICICKWLVSTFLFGMISLAELVPSRRLSLLG